MSEDRAECKTEIDPENSKEDEAKVQCCPRCCRKQVVSCLEWEARSTDPHDRDNIAMLTEYQCRECDTSFWA